MATPSLLLIGNTRNTAFRWQRYLRGRTVSLWNNGSTNSGIVHSTECYCRLDAASAKLRSFSSSSNPLKNASKDESGAAGSFFTSEETNVQTEQRLDFFGEPITFVNAAGGESLWPSPIGDATLALDLFLLAVISRGKTADGGGDQHGIETQAAHATAKLWSSLLRLAWRWNYYYSEEEEEEVNCLAPMLAVTAVAPLLAQTGSAYVAYLDTLLASPDVFTDEQQHPHHHRIQLMDLARRITSISTEFLSSRERFHLSALRHLMKDEHNLALHTYLLLLQRCPGDGLALTLVLDLATTVGDTASAQRAVTSVASYWKERDYRGLRPPMAGHSVVTSLVAVGLGLSSSRFFDAEGLADRSLNRDEVGSAGVALWALAHVYHAEGRASEGTSKLAGYDGVRLYDTCGWLFFDSRLGGYGGRFILDRDAASAGRSALRRYDISFERVLDYSGRRLPKTGTDDDEEEELKQLELDPPLFAPTFRRNAAMSYVGSFFRGILGTSKFSQQTQPDTNSGDNNGKQMENPSSGPETMSLSQNRRKRTLEDVLTWLPPTPQLLADATLLLIRLTLADAITIDDHRWKDLAIAWNHMKYIHSTYSSNSDESMYYEFCPLVRVTSAMFDSNLVRKTEAFQTTAMDRLVDAAHIVGHLWKLHHNQKDDDVEKVTESSSSSSPKPGMDWASVVHALAEARQGILLSMDNSDDINFPTVRPIHNDSSSALTDLDSDVFFDVLLCHAALQSDDIDSLCLARAVCSESVSLRPNAAEIWMRYSMVLEKLGDYVAASDARAAGISFGSGEGGFGAH